MVAERRRYSWMDKTNRPNLYDYAQQRIKERALEGKTNILSDEDKLDLEKLMREQYAQE